VKVVSAAPDLRSVSIEEFLTAALAVAAESHKPALALVIARNADDPEFMRALVESFDDLKDLTDERVLTLTPNPPHDVPLGVQAPPDYLEQSSLAAGTIAVLGRGDEDDARAFWAYTESHLKPDYTSVNPVDLPQAYTRTARKTAEFFGLNDAVWTPCAVILSLADRRMDVLKLRGGLYDLARHILGAWIAGGRTGPFSAAVDSAAQDSHLTDVLHDGSWRDPEGHDWSVLVRQHD
jgi:hypothetical protein